MSPALLAPVLAALLAAATPIQTSHFVFDHAAGGERLARHLAARAEAVYTDVSRQIGGHVPPGRILVRVAVTPAQFQAMQPGPPAARWAQAVAYPARGLIVIRGWGDTHPEETLAHEVCHIVLERALGGRPVPTWLAEGLAMHYAGQWWITRWATLSRATLFGSLIPLPELTRAFPQGEAQARLAYAESYSLVTFIRREFGEGSLRRLVRTLAAGGSPDRALRAATGLPPAELERRWVRELRLHFSWVPILTSSTAVWMLLMAVSFYVWRRKKLAARQVLRRWEEEEAMEETRGSHNLH